MHHNVRETIASSNTVGYPDTFLTTTCIKQWKKITYAYLPRQQVTDCADSCAQMFYRNTSGDGCLKRSSRKF